MFGASIMRGREVREEIQQLVQQRPFRPFVLNFENGDRVTVEHPENIAFDPNGRSNRVHVITGEIVVYSNFDAVTSVIHQDTGQTIGA
jgi:hypothetical protein